jgi:hypothetical protein
MLVSSHLKKIARFEEAMSLLHPLDDFELWFWSAMLGGTNAVNVALHMAQVTPAESAFPSQPGVYHVPDENAPGGHRAVLQSLGDVLHVGRPPIQGPVPDDVQRMMHAMEIIESHRDPCTRGESEPTADIVAQCQAAYAECLGLLRKRLAEVPA